MRIEKWELRNENREMRIEKWEMRNENREMRNEKWEIRNEKWEMRNENSVPSLCLVWGYWQQNREINFLLIHQLARASNYHSGPNIYINQNSLILYQNNIQINR